ncbi:MAG TPA: glucose-6-phosphate isomerase, partial [Bacteroidales bacterium]|nr:glucose-6-phosphate isomerase [Bacteroidales bacterium]
MAPIKININRISKFTGEDQLKSLQPEIDKHYKLLTEKNGAGNEFLGWLTLPEETLNSSLIKKINDEALRFRATSELVVVIGIGGSYLGARAIIDALSAQFKHYQKGNPEIIYAGQNISEDYLFDLMQLLNKRDYSIIVIS